MESALTSDLDQKSTSRLIVRTPIEVVVDVKISGLTAEDRTGRFGVRPGCEPLFASLVPGILTYRSPEGDEAFVAVGRGVLEAGRRRILVTVRDATTCEALAEVRESILRGLRTRSQGEAAMSETFRSMYRRFLKHLVQAEKLQ